MPYKPSLMTRLLAEYEDASKKFMDAADEDAKKAEGYLRRMKLLGKNIEYTQRMIDGTMGKPVIIPGVSTVAR